MAKEFKPEGYNAVSPYFVVKGAAAYIDFLRQLFDAKPLRRYDDGNGTIVHAEVLVDDSVLMIADSNEHWPPNTHMMHVYVADVDAVFKKAMALGCRSIGEPQQKGDDPDRRGTFVDFAGNMWSVGTQQ